MIRSIEHKGLKRLLEDDDASRLLPDMVDRIRNILTILADAATLDDLDLPPYRLHALKGDLNGFHAMTVRANWRIIFRFEVGDVFDLNFVDCH